VIELIIVILVVMWLLGYFGRGRFYYREPITPAPLYAGSLIHLIIVLAVILLILRLLRLA
jgi:hypothetical protein